MESFGARLKKEREQRKISLDDISVSTKIAPRFLLAIEQEQFDQLPGGIFNKGFVRAYARHLGLDENQVVSDFVAASGGALPEKQPEEIPVPVPLISPAEQRKNLDATAGIPWELLAVVLLVVAFGFALWGFHSREKHPQPGTAPQPANSENSRAPVASAATRPEPPLTQAAISAPPPSASPETAAPAAIATPPASAPDPGAFLVRIKARQDSWVNISADGKEIMHDVLHASAEKSVGARNQIVIKTGNAGALDISFNGKDIPAPGAYNEVKTLAFDPNGLISR